MKKKFLWCMTVLTALLSASCSSELAFEGTSPYDGVTGEEVDVTFSISAEGTQMQTRAGGPGQYQNKVGKGQEIDMLIYAVYEKEGDKYNLLKQYGKGIVEDENGLTFETGDAAAPAIGAKVPADYDGQTIINVGDKFKNGETEEITLRLMRGKEYHIAFWAQSSQTTAFATDDLENVEVIYANAKNNDELRDAFCKVESFSVSPAANARTVILTRPMAQINVGTTGADYKHLLLYGNTFPNKAITQSKIYLQGVAQKLNVVTDQIDGTELTTADFTYGIIPAFMNMGRTTFPVVEEDADFYYKPTDPREELLKVDLDGDGKVVSYKTNYPTLGKNGEFLTETFKYLSMCYALVPASVEPTTGTKPEYASSVLERVVVTFAETEGDGKPAADYTTIDLTNVPVHRNWRTNILGGFQWKKDPGPTDPEEPDDPGYIPDPKDPDDPDDPDNPDDPNDPVYPDGPYDPTDPDNPTPTPDDDDDDPDDPTSIFKFTNARIFLDNLFDDEYNGTLGEGSEDGDGNEYLEYPDPSEEENNGGTETE